MMENMNKTIYQYCNKCKEETVHKFSKDGKSLDCSCGKKNRL